MAKTSTKSSSTGLRAKYEDHPTLRKELSPVAIIGAIAAVVIAIVGAVAFMNRPTQAQSNLDKDPSSVKLRTLAGAILQYNDDHGVLPELKTSADLQKLFPDGAAGKAGPVWQMPGTPDDYAVNPVISGKKMSDLPNANKIVAVYEPGSDSLAARKVAMLDGHVESVSKDAWPSVKSSSGIQ
jgi:hypothetical protein